MEPRDPSDYPTRILLCVSGMTPQIITETLYSLPKIRCSGIPLNLSPINCAFLAWFARITQARSDES